ncbi:MAG: TIGR02996 domain-containing protein [Rubripirellula sp.]|nr:TIGR02996 domain-containing protein [Rubripirellula sp.]
MKYEPDETVCGSTSFLRGGGFDVTGKPESIPNTVPPRRFEYADDRSYKFWTIALNDERLTMRYGRIGHLGKAREIRCDSAEDAKRSYQQRIRKKTREGYAERIPAKSNTADNENAWDAIADHEPFLQAILASPDEPTPYAIYADWLSEQQDPRGEFTRQQLALEDPRLPLYKRPKLEKSVDLLRQRNARRWLGDLAPWLIDGGKAAYPFRFDRGQLAAIVCEKLSYRFAHKLKESPYCRFLTELAIGSTEVLGDTIRIGDQEYQAATDYGVEPLLGGDFGNLRQLHVGALPAASHARLSFSNPAKLIQWIGTMPRLERLWIHADVDLGALLRLPLTQLRELHVRLDRAQIKVLSRSGRVQQLQVLGSLSLITEETVDALVQLAGFDQLNEFICQEVSEITEPMMARLEATGIMLDVVDSSD